MDEISRIRAIVDAALPLPEGFPKLDTVERRHLLAGYLIAGSYERAAVILGVSPRTIRTRLAGLKIKGRHAKTMKLDAVPGIDLGPDLSYPCHRDFEMFDWYYNQDSIKMPGTRERNGEANGN